MTKKIETRFPDYKVYLNCKARTEQAASHHSVMSLVHKSLVPGIKIYTSQFPTTAGRFLAMKISAHDAERSLYTANVYFPTAGDNTDTKIDLISTLDIHISIAKAEGARIVIAGDMNATTSTSHRSGYSEGISTARADTILRRFTVRNELSDASSNTTFSDTHTWYATDLNKSAKLDHVFTDSPDTATTTVVDEAPFAISDHLYTIVSIHPDAGTITDIPAKQPPSPRINLEHRDTLATIWKERLDLILRTTTLSNNPHEKLEQAQQLALTQAEEIYGFCVHFHKKPFASATINRLSKQLALLRSLRRHLWSILSNPLPNSEPRQKAHKRWTELNPTSTQFDLQLQFPNINPQTVSATQISEHLETLHTFRTTLTDHKNKTIREMQTEQTKQYANRLRKQLFSPGTRAIQKATGKSQAVTTMTALRSRHPNEITFDISQDPHLAHHIQQYCNAQTTPHRMISDSQYCWITLDIHTDLHACILHSNANQWPITRIRSTNITLEPLDIKPETNNSNILASIEYELVTNARDIATKCTQCNNTHHQHPTLGNLIAISSEHNATRSTHNYCTNCKSTVEIKIDKAHYDKLPFPETILTDNKIPDNNTETLRTPVDLALLRATIRTFKSRKSAGDDGMLPELWKDAPDSLLNILLDNVNLALLTGKIPDEWRGGTIRFLLKKQPDDEFKNWRPVVLLRLAYKIYTKIINDRLRDMAERHGLLSQAQEGFRSQHSVQRQIIRLTTMMANAKRKKLTAFLTLADFSNAFNSAPHSCIIKVLNLLGIPDTDIIADLLDRTTFRSINNIGTTANIGLTRGIKQGAVESPLIFCLFAEALLRLLDDANRKFRSDQNISETAGYADDLAIFSASKSPRTAESNHAELHKRLELYSTWADIHFNIPKCVITARNFKSNTTPNTQTMTLNSRPLPHNAHNKAAPYLGAWISLNGDFKTERALVIAKLKRTAILLKNTVYTRSQVERLLNMCIIPLFTFTAGIVNWTQTELNHINSIWAGVRKYAWKLPLQTSSAPFTTAEKHGGLDYEPAESFLLKTQHNVIEQCLQHDDELRQILITSTKDALRLMGVNTIREASTALKLNKHNDICQWNPVIRHLRWLSNINDEIETDLFDLDPLSTHYTLTHLLQQQRTKAKFDTHSFTNPTSQRTTHTTTTPQWELALRSLTRHQQSRSSNFISSDRTRIRSWNHLSPQAKSAVSRLQYEALYPILHAQLSNIQTHASPHKTQHSITSFTSKQHTQAQRKLDLAHTPQPPDTDTYRTHPKLRLRQIPTLDPRKLLPPRTLQCIHTPSSPNPQPTILATHTYSRNLHLQQTRALSNPRARPTATSRKLRSSTLSFDYDNSKTHTQQLTPQWLATTQHGFTSFIQRTPIPKPVKIHGTTQIISTFKHDTLLKIDKAVLATYTHRQNTSLTSDQSIKQVIQLATEPTTRFLHWNLTTAIQKLTSADTILGSNPILTDPSFHTLEQTNTLTPTIVHITKSTHSHKQWRAHLPHNNIFIHQGKPDTNTHNTLIRHGYTSTLIPRFTRLEQTSTSITTGAYTTQNTATPWSIYHKPLHTQHIRTAIHEATEQTTLSHHDTGLWHIYHNHSQYGKYLDDPTTLVATDGSHDPQNPHKQMGGGIAYRHGDGTDSAIGVRGSPSSFGAEAGTLDHLLQNTPNDQSLNILIDAQSLIQQIQRLTQGETHINLTKHPHRIVLQSIVDKLTLHRTAKTTLIKIKSHAGAILNERADVLANDGRTAALTGMDPHDPAHIHHTHDTIHGTKRYESVKHRNTTWVAKLQAHHQPKLLAQDSTTYKFMIRDRQARQHIKKAVTQTTDDFTDKDGKHFLQAYTGTFPTKHKLWLMNRSDSGFCPFCPHELEHMVHWQCLCPHFHDSRQAAHNAIVQSFHSDLRRHAHKEWTITTETPMRSTTFATTQPHRNWQPDGIATRKTSKQAILLELTRCDDDRHNINLAARERKEIKYDDLLQDLRDHNNNWTFDLHTTAIGYLSSTDTDHLAHLYRRLNIPPKSWEKITQNLVNATVRAFAKMARERQAALIKIEPPSTHRPQYQKATMNNSTPQHATKTRRRRTKHTAFTPVSTQRKKRKRKKR